MRVCNVCLAPPAYTGTPTIKQMSKSDEQYLFGLDWMSATVDFCAECLDAMRKGRWDTLAERAHDVLMLRLGVPTNGS